VHCMHLKWCLVTNALTITELMFLTVINRLKGLSHQLATCSMVGKSKNRRSAERF
jgi:hypothetical protein